VGYTVCGVVAVSAASRGGGVLVMIRGWRERGSGSAERSWVEADEVDEFNLV